ncbi:DUF2934 domain-containing protein [Roseomonas marmotae]|uniref:DUF2934 domain-containing protein n=1 Tax=Roseomonas marmotae TaxID=2768161 RepID=A0ABS3K818_9PROT|nr:DUF2934 domain-containing protein [Roseomonas marmotae]MBO1073616.1 DUF2934 domain-containing protein [Roseomonas marmotae]MBO1073646.1 DUF2934 domain-containing protein [Roseomonas marmotae]QTI80204.1 DUF2934 domain-containing protein [Roseomonas marmotae]
MSDDLEDLEQRIRERAYTLWEADGRPEGSSDEYWYRARAEVAATERSGSLEDQLADTFPASDPLSVTDPDTGARILPAPPEDEPLPARSATLEERPEAPVDRPRASARKKSEDRAAAAPAPAAKPAAKPRAPRRKPAG